MKVEKFDFKNKNRKKEVYMIELYISLIEESHINWYHYEEEYNELHARKIPKYFKYRTWVEERDR